MNDQVVDSDGAPVPVMTASANEQVIHLQARQGPVKAVLFAGQR